MKQLFVSLAIIAGLIISFAVIDSKDFNHYDNVQGIQEENPSEQHAYPFDNQHIREKMGGGATVEKKFLEDIQSTEAKPTKNNLQETAPAAKMIGSVVERKQTEDNSAEVSPTAESKTLTDPKSDNNKHIPAAVPVVTAKEAEILNNEAKEYAKPFDNRNNYLKNGFKLVINDKLNRFQIIRPTPKQETVLINNEYDLEEFKRRQIPHGWALDIDKIPRHTLFKKQNNGFEVDTTTGCVFFQARKLDSMRSSFFIEVIVKNESKEKECEISLGVYGKGTIKNGYSMRNKEILQPGQEQIIQCEISVYDRYIEISPAVSINGIAVIKELNVYRYDHKEITLVEGEIIARSPLPDPQTTDYSDCRYTAHFVGNTILGGNPCNKEVVLSVDGFIDKKILSSNQLKQNDKIKCAIIPFDSVPDELSGTQEADTLSLYELDSCYLLSYKTIRSFSDYSETNLGIPFSDDDSVKKEYISIFKKKINPALSKEEKNAQKESIVKDLTRINQMFLSYSDENIKKINDEFNVTWEKEKAKDSPGVNRIGEIVWRNVDNSFYALPESYILINDYPKISQHNIEALVALKDYLESQGIQLIVSLVPHFYDIAARVINHEYSAVPDFRTASVVKQLLENGIEAIYASDVIISKYNKYENPFFYPADAHPGDLPQDVLSDMVTERLSRLHFIRTMKASEFQIVREKYSSLWMSMSNFSFPKKCDIGEHQPGDFYSVNRIRYQDQEIRNNPNSQVLVLGNSYSNAPEPISKYLCMKMGINIYHYSIAGSGILLTSTQRIFNNPEHFLTNRKALVLSIGTIHLTENVVIPNIRTLDSDTEYLSNSHLIKTIEITGKETTIPDFALQLSNPSILRTDGDGVCSILDDYNNLTSFFDPTKNGFIVVYYCFPASTPFKLVVNGVSYPLTATDDSAMYLRQVIPVSQGKTNLSLKMVGKPNTLFAIGRIQIYVAEHLKIPNL